MRSIALVAYNNARMSIGFTVDWKGKVARYTLPPHSTATLVWSARS